MNEMTALGRWMVFLIRSVLDIPQERYRTSTPSSCDPNCEEENVTQMEYGVPLEMARVITILMGS